MYTYKQYIFCLVTEDGVVTSKLSDSYTVMVAKDSHVRENSISILYNALF